MEIKVLVSGCKKCNTLGNIVTKLIAENNINANIEITSDYQEIAKYGVLSTPALVINEQVKSLGIIPKEEKILEWLREG